ncbi:hypothetical protein BofuT4_uP138320.1 [Botrytis cinerea T4]|uniref:Uncharacterized protein n=1 Tax=Botryotinia fuckeliana (strain T4) TaxID=999810 RepID=G2YMR0_BOTF4|nr:hypothetical protein BofuT4_uP138320.1 [Botrytis cinerea T4]
MMASSPKSFSMLHRMHSFPGEVPQVEVHSYSPKVISRGIYAIAKKTTDRFKASAKA